MGGVGNEDISEAMGVDDVDDVDDEDNNINEAMEIYIFFLIMKLIFFNLLLRR